MWFMNCLIVFASIIQLCLIVLASAAGLYYLADIVEEHTVASGKFIKTLIFVSSMILIGFVMFEDMPLTLIGTCLLTNVMYVVVMGTFPLIELSSPKFLLSLGLLIVDHYLAFSFFLTTQHSFSEVLAFFTVCLWLVPIALFISLSAGDYVLPTCLPRSDLDSDVVTNYFQHKDRRFKLLSFLKSVEEAVLPRRTKKGF